MKEYAPFALAAMAFFCLVSVSICYFGVPIALQGRADFRMLYAAGYMVRNHQSAAIYRYDDQVRHQNALVSPEGVALPFDHPAYEALTLAPLSRLSYRNAYLVVFALNLGLLAICARLLWPWTKELATVSRGLPAAIVLGFLPVAITLIQGQDSIVLLMLLASAALFLEGGNTRVSSKARRDGREFLDQARDGKQPGARGTNEIAAGVCVGLALFKPQFALPIALLFLMWRRWKFVTGFSATAITLAMISVLVTGQAASREYVSLLLSVGSASSATNQLRLGVYPLEMANLRGLFSAGFSSAPWAARVATAAGSLLVLLFCSRRRPSFALALAAAALVSYHGLIHDMSFLVIAAGAMLENGLRMRSRSAITIALALLASPTVLFLARAPYFVMAIPLIAALGWNADALRMPGMILDPIASADPDTQQISR